MPRIGYHGTKSTRWFDSASDIAISSSVATVARSMPSREFVGYTAPNRPSAQPAMAAMTTGTETGHTVFAAGSAIDSEHQHAVARSVTPAIAPARCGMRRVNSPAVS